MTSPMDALILPAAALVVMLVAILVIFLVGQSSQTVDSKINVETGEAKAYTALSSSLKAGGNYSSYNNISYIGSGREMDLNDQVFRRSLSGFTYASLKLESEYNSKSIAEKGDRGYAGGFGLKRVAVPLRGGKTGALILKYEVN